MQEITREQESAIARLAIKYPSVQVAPPENGIVTVTAGGVATRIDEDGTASPVVFESVPIRLPLNVLGGLLGHEYVAELVRDKMAEGETYPDYAVGHTVQASAVQAIEALLAAGVR
jgi:hypothetical protein